jgi:hypothetical protein
LSSPKGKSLVHVGQGQGEGHRAVAVLGDAHQTGIEDLPQRRGHVVDLGVGHRHEAPVLLPRRVVHRLETLDLGVEVLLAEGTEVDLGVARAGDVRGSPQAIRRTFGWRIEPVGE